MTSRWWLALVPLCLILLSAGCDGDAPPFDRTLSTLHPDLTYLKDGEGRYVHLRGVNVGGSNKVPIPVTASGAEKPFTYVGRPFPLDEADRYFTQLRELGFNSIRLLFIWEAIFPLNPEEADTEYLDYFEALIQKANEHGIYVLINAHENLWSRHLYANYTENPECSERAEKPCVKGDIEDTLWSLFPNPANAAKPETRPSLDKLLWANMGGQPQDDYADYEKGYTDWVGGDGAPMWAVRLCLPEKAWPEDPLGYPAPWGMHHLLGVINTTTGKQNLTAIKTALGALGMGSAGEVVDQVAEKAPETPFKITETTDFFPWTMWGVNAALSLDMERCYAAFFAGDIVFPNTRVKDGKVVILKAAADVAKLPPDVQSHFTFVEPEEGKDLPNLKEYLQASFKKAWVEIAKRASQYPNVIGYDLMNEPTSIFIVLTAVSLYFQRLGDEGLEATVEGLLTGLLPQELPLVGKAGTLVFKLLTAFEMLPPLNRPPLSDDDKLENEQVKWDWGFGDANLMAIAGLNIGMSKNYLQPLFEDIGQAIQMEDPAAIIWLEPAFSPDMLLSMGGLGGGEGRWEQNMTVPDGVERTVYSPHWYPDIYPNLGFNQPSREFREDEFAYRDYTATLKSNAAKAAYSLSNIPVVYGEFGTYWNFRYLNTGDPNKPGYEQSREQGYRLSAEVLDNYYEAFESLFMSNMVWCYTTDNDPKYGDWWNHEDFSIIDENQEPRGWTAYARPYPRALPGKPVSMHFYSPHHYYDPEQGVPDPDREFELVFEARESDAPAVIYVPSLQYPEGFYVGISDGYVVWDNNNQWLYYYPERNDPKWRHKVLIHPPIPGQDVSAFDYFIRGTSVVSTAD